jgi:hypothetical protein
MKLTPRYTGRMNKFIGLRLKCGKILMVLPTSHKIIIEMANPHWFSIMAIVRKIGPNNRVNTEIKRSIMENAR